MHQFKIYECKNGFLLNIYIGQRSESWVFKVDERMRMLAHIDKLLGEEPVKTDSKDEPRND
jgi:hypothetical protein